MFDDLYHQGRNNFGLCRFLSIALVLSVGGLGQSLANQAVKLDHVKIDGGQSIADQDLGLPKILSENDVVLYGRIFALQESGKWKAADCIIGLLEDKLLMGHVQFQRYMHPRKYRSRYRELKGWLAQYADHPGATRIYKLAMRRRPKNYRMPVVPPSLRRAQGFADTVSSSTYRSPRKRTKEEWRHVRQIKRQIKRNVRREILTVSQKILERKDVKHLLAPAERDNLLTQISAGWFYRGNARKALAIAGPAADRSRKFFSSADWVAGLSAWRLKDVMRAGRHFEALAHSSIADDWNRAAGAFWAARAYLVNRQPERVNSLLAMAAGNPRTFYGLIAVRQLGVDFDLQWNSPPLTIEGVEHIGKTPGVRRAIALAQVGQRDLAKRELRRSYLLDGHSNGPTLLALATKLKFPAMQMRIAAGVRGKDGRLYDQALFPVPPWRPTSGFVMDRALIFAFMRQESAFKVRAKSRMGALGLMQLMPRTASYMAGDSTLGRRNKWKLYEPEFNLELGQKYLTYLMRDQLVQGDLFRLAVAYNAGPGNLRNWLRKAEISDDPLLFVESIPWRESRLFVERVLTNLWIYRRLMHQVTPSLDAVATGRWPILLNLDTAKTTGERNAGN